ncbi:MAG: hypothetical protein IPL20_03160 [Saprospiraceae bacterium]|nr:hypothetical protein [Saprospiraceae bacterium]
MSNLWNGLSKMLNSENEIALFSYQTNTCKPNPLFFKSYIDLANERYNNITSFVKVGDDLKTDKGGESIGVNFLHVYRKDKNFNLAEALKSIL